MVMKAVNKGGEDSGETADRSQAAGLWATRTGAARLVGLSEGAVRKAVERGQLPTYRAADGTLLIHLADLAAYRPLIDLAQRR